VGGDSLNRDSRALRAGEQKDGVPVLMSSFVLLILFHLEYVWRFGAYSPYGTTSAERILFFLAGLLLTACVMLEAVWSILAYRSARWRLIRAVSVLFVAACIWRAGDLVDASALRSMAFHRDIGRRAQHWAEGMLSGPDHEFLDPMRVDPKTGDVGSSVKEALVPNYLKGGQYSGVRLRANDSESRYLIITYRWGDAEGYEIGNPGLLLPISNDVLFRRRMLIPGVYAWISERV
jgi:hypothetical protein